MDVYEIIISLKNKIERTYLELDDPNRNKNVFIELTDFLISIWSERILFWTIETENWKKNKTTNKRMSVRKKRRGKEGLSKKAYFRKIVFYESFFVDQMQIVETPSEYLSADVIEIAFIYSSTTQTNKR